MAMKEETIGPLESRSKNATADTKAINEHYLRSLPFEDELDFEDARRGFIAPLPDGGMVKDGKGQIVWDLGRFSFIEQDAKAPDTINPSLWRQSQLVVQGGLFKVVDGLYQVRTADLSNITFFEGDDGIVVADPLISVETARAALGLYYRHRPKKPVVAVIHSHSHVDHFGGVRGVIDEADVKSGKVKIIAPEGFLEAAVSENVMAGNVMSRRATYMYGNLLAPGPKGQVGAGLGVTTSSGTLSLLPPTDLITETGQRMNIAGLDFEFMLAPDTEAPAEMHWYIEQFKAVTAAENCCHTMHNTYTLRGAKIRDPLAWSKYLDQTIQMWGGRSEVMYGMHHWPVWGTERVLEMLTKARDGYRFINDQTLRLANHGLTPVEIAEHIELPKEVARHWAFRGYYGSLNHNVKATYVRYLGWFDGNPAHLHELPPEERGSKYVEFMGGAESVLEKAKDAFERGEYRWVAEIVNHVVFADPTNQRAKELQADALEQLGYQAESGPWRNFYLTGAKELRDGVMQLPVPVIPDDFMRSVSIPLLLDSLAVQLNGPKSEGRKITLNLTFIDSNEPCTLILDNAALSHRYGVHSEDADATIELRRASLIRMLAGQSSMDDQIRSGEIRIQGRGKALNELLSMLDTFEFWFNIVTP
ncbi:MAG: alkyl sulfatase dimerization domain-containing protein [Methanomassiliicoccus sp.]|nr:alkyl sulfatase dimerization domain-containing protein [Methanomassiliicoccus sp.]